MIQPHSRPQHPQQLHKEGQDASCPPATKKPRLTIHPVHVAIPVHAPSGMVAVSTSAITAAAVAASSMSSSTASDPSSHPTPSSVPVTTLNGFRVNSFNIHRLLITCLMIAAKFTSDLFYSNARYAKVGGLSLPELNQLELEFLFTTRFELNVKVDELQRVGNSLLLFKNQASRPVAQNLAPQVPQPQYQRPRVSTAAASATNAVINSFTTEIATIASTTTAQPAKPGKFSIPSPTSPRNGPMSDHPHGSSSSSSSTPVTLVATSRPVANRGQLLSPPEEKQPWTDDVQATEE
ncbi:hypothetical protein BG006_008310 [Podila minutissima]|uniref:Cyclin-domain-containing protein n=1 Tax=Podila minutissima TaxID=64525 RepID=A0A9P5SK83_9FUNG|nr:hypothetical protein BG006_008310 [Podila minutissima]